MMCTIYFVKQLYSSFICIRDFELYRTQESKTVFQASLNENEQPESETDSSVEKLHIDYDCYHNPQQQNMFINKSLLLSICIFIFFFSFLLDSKRIILTWIL